MSILAADGREARTLRWDEPPPLGMKEIDAPFRGARRWTALFGKHGMFSLIASVDQGSMHVSIAHNRRYPTWDEILAVRAWVALAGQHHDDLHVLGERLRTGGAVTKPTPVLAETIDRLSVRRAAVARELAILDEAIAALQRIRVSEPISPPPVTAPARPDLRHQDSPRPAPPPSAAHAPAPRPTVCGLSTCGKPLPPPVRAGGRPRQFCNDRCADQARKSATRPAVDNEDPTDRAIRLHKELNPVPESGTAYRRRAKVDR